MKIPKISVIMSVFNDEKYLKESIESILNQTYKNFEFIIVDDGSIDRTSVILKNYTEKDPRIKTIINEKNIGLTKSLNKAIKIAQEIKVLGTFGYKIDKYGNFLTKQILPISSKQIKKTLIKRNPFVHTSVMIEKEIINRIGKYNEKFRTSQDYELWFRILRTAKTANLPLFLVKKRYHKDMVSLKKHKNQLKYTLFFRKQAIKREDYSRLCYIYFLKPYFSLKCPLFLNGK